jgi:anthranilate synthase component 1
MPGMCPVSIPTHRQTADVRPVDLTADDLRALAVRFRDRYPVLLESAGGEPPLGHYDVLLAAPGERLQLDARGLSGPHAQGRFLDALDAWFAQESVSAVPVREPFAGGWFLYLGYELAGEIEPTLRMSRGSLPVAIAWRMHAAIVVDRGSGQAWIAAEPDHADTVHSQLESDRAAFKGAPTLEAPAPLLSGGVEEEPGERYETGVRAALEAIARGDVYQANLSRRWRARLAPGVDAAQVYARLRSANPAPFAGFAQLPGFCVLSSSPERLLRIDRRVASTRPIAGTRPRGATAASDATLRTELRLNEKEQAEHVMLVDLERNDLGRICRAGTVRVDEYMTIESYTHVHHIVSNVRGELRDDVTPGQAIAAVFPGGTITGCPKIRCIELLSDLEPEPREAYTGSMGYLRLDGDLDLNILIRTMTVAQDRLEFRTGAGIVADSQPALELAETRAKARGLLRALGVDG